MSRLLSFRRLGRTRRLRGGVRWTDGEEQQTDGKKSRDTWRFFSDPTKLPKLPPVCLCRLPIDFRINF